MRMKAMKNLMRARRSASTLRDDVQTFSTFDTDLVRWRTGVLPKTEIRSFESLVQLLLESCGSPEASARSLGSFFGVAACLPYYRRSSSALVRINKLATVEACS